SEVCAGQMVHIADSHDFLVMPDDLPDGSTVSVSNLNEATIVTEIENMQRCGNVFDIVVNTPADTSYTGNFTLTMLYCNGFAADDIYLYNGDTKEWEKQNGEFNYDDFSITIHPSHFSKYGVFALDE